MLIDFEQVKDALRRIDEKKKKYPSVCITESQLRDIFMEDAKQVYSVKDVAELLQVVPETVKRFIRKGELKAAKLGKDWRISRSDLAEFYQRQGGGSLFENS